MHQTGTYHVLLADMDVTGGQYPVSDAVEKRLTRFSMRCGMGNPST